MIIIYILQIKLQMKIDHNQQKKRESVGMQENKVFSQWILKILTIWMY